MSMLDGLRSASSIFADSMPRSILQRALDFLKQSSSRVIAHSGSQIDQQFISVAKRDSQTNFLPDVHRFYMQFKFNRVRFFLAKNELSKYGRREFMYSQAFAAR